MTEESRPEKGRSRKLTREQVGRALAIAAAVYAVVFAVVNLDKVKVDWVLSSGQTPLIVVIVACLLIGAGVDRVLVRRARKRGGG
jgi:uncharacterized integral membrane protein